MKNTKQLLEPKQNVNRRELLAALGTTGAITTAGCMGGVDDNKEDNNQENDTDQHTTTDQTNDTTTTDETDNTDDTTTDNTFNPGWNPHDILPADLGEYGAKGLTNVIVRQNFSEEDRFEGVPNTNRYVLDIPPGQHISTVAFRAVRDYDQIGVLNEDFTEEDFLETVNSPQSKITDANIQHQENVTYAKGEEAEAAYTTDQNERPVIITDKEIEEDLQHIINYMNNGQQDHIAPQNIQEEPYKTEAAILEHGTGAAHHEQIEQKLSQQPEQITGMRFSATGVSISYSESPGQTIDYDEIDI